MHACAHIYHRLLLSIYDQSWETQPRRLINGYQLAPLNNGQNYIYIYIKALIASINMINLKIDFVNKIQCTQSL